MLATCTYLYIYMHTIKCKFPHGVKSLVNETSSPKTLTHRHFCLEILENAVRSRRSPSGREISSSPSVPRRWPPVKALGPSMMEPWNMVIWPTQMWIYFSPIKNGNITIEDCVYERHCNGDLYKWFQHISTSNLVTQAALKWLWINTYTYHF